MTTTTSNSKSTSASALATSLTWPEWFATLVVMNVGLVPVWLATDGSTAAAGGEGMDLGLPGSVSAFANRGVRPDIIRSDWPGTTQVSLVTASGTAEVIVSPQ